LVLTNFAGIQCVKLTVGEWVEIPHFSLTWLVAVNTVLALYDAACDDDKGKGRARLSGGYRGGLEAHVPREGRG